MNKKYFTLFIAMLLIFTLCFTIVACGETDDDKTNDNKPIEKPSVEDQQPSDGDALPSVPDEPSEPETPGDGEENEEDTTSLVFELKEDDTYKVTGYTGEPISIVIPSSYNGKAVTSIGENAFYNCTSLISVRIPNSVTNIADKAFYGCVRLVEVYNLSNLTITEDESNGYVGNYALDVYTSLDNPSKLSIDNNGYIIYTDGEERTLVGYSGDETELVIPNGINIINKYAFCEVSTIDDFVIYGTETRVTAPNTAITSIVIPNSVTRIEAHAFHWCDRLTSITIPSSVTSMGEHAFNDCVRLVEVYNLSSLNIIEDYSDYGDVGYYALDVYTSLDTPSKLSTDSNGYIIYTNGEEKLLVGYTGNETELILPNGITAINNCAFFHIRTITSVEIPNSVLSIGYGVFSGCISLIEVKIGDSVKSIGNGAFNYCGSLTSVTIPNSVTSIGSVAFADCTSLTSVTIGNSVTSIGDYAFEYCSSLTSVTIPNSVTSIGSWTFSSCSSLTSVTIPNSVTSIGSWTFSGCDSLTSVTIPNTVTIIGGYAFAYCSSLTTINYEGTSEGWDNISKGYDWNYNTDSYTINYNYKIEE